MYDTTSQGLALWLPGYYTTTSTQTLDKTLDNYILMKVVSLFSLQQFSIDSSSNTLELVNPYLAISALDVGQRIGFSWLDEVAINNYYSCEGDCVMRCENGGYVRKLDSDVCRCVCPEGLSKFCFES